MITKSYTSNSKAKRRPLYDLLLSEKFEKLEFFISHAFGPHHRLCLQAMPDGSCLVQFAGSSYCRIPQFDETFLESEQDDRYGRQIFLERSRWRRLAQLLDSCDLLDWDTWLADGNLNEGTHWYLDIACSGARRVCRAGCDAYPPPWDRFMALIRREIDHRIC